MYKVMMIDDELEILFGAQLIIDWSAAGFELSKLCSNGQDALNTLRQEPIDLVITDIRMPRMDGLTLVSLIQQDFPNIKMIVLSGYDDFIYAKTAFKAGVVDYMLKPLDAAELVAVLQSIKQDLDQERSLQIEQKSETSSTKSVGEYQLIHSLLTGYDQTIIDENIHLLNQLETKQYRLLISHSTISQLPGNNDDDSDRIQKTTFMKLNNSTNVCFHTLHHKTSVFLLEQEADLPKKLDHIWRELQDMQVYCSAMLSPVLEDLHSLNKQYAMLKKHLEHEIFFGSGNVLYLYKSTCIQASQSLDWTMNQNRARLRNVLLGQDSLSLEEYFSSLVTELRLKKNILTVEQGRTFWRLFSTCCLDTLKSVFHISQDSADEFSYGCVLIKYFLSVEEISSHLLFLIQTVLTTSQIGTSVDAGATISQICFYLQVHAYEDISLGQIAEIFHMNPSYLSRIFHEKTNMSFWNYVVQLRLEKAKKMLRSTNESMKAIAHACGFQSEKSFFSSFKKNVGCTPGSFRSDSYDSMD